MKTAAMIKSEITRSDEEKEREDLNWMKEGRKNEECVKKEMWK